MVQKSPDLDTAKARLRESLSTLENTVEKRISAAKDQAKNAQTSDAVHSLQSENKHLKEELSTIQKQAGAANLKFAESEKLRAQASKRVGQLIETLEGAA